MKCRMNDADCYDGLVGKAADMDNQVSPRQKGT